jgi:DNA segregation ATPase FtsK/SpoIIIE, S-DNA-T family
VNAATIGEYRTITGEAAPRVLLLLDGFSAFRDAFDTSATSGVYATVLRILSEGRQFGVHLAIAADRAGALPTAVLAGVQERVVLRLADESTYLVLGAPNDVLTAASPPGRALVAEHETQVAVPGGSPNVLEQAKAIEALAAALRLGGSTVQAPSIRALATEIDPADLPDRVGDRPVLGVSDDDLLPIGFEPSGSFVVAGGPGSGRTTALVSIARAVRRFDPDAELYYFGRRRSVVRESIAWTGSATTPEEIQALAREIAPRIAAAPPGEDGARRIVAVVEGIADFLSGPADAPLVEVIKSAKRNEHLVIAESESSTWTSSWPLLAEMKSGRRGIVLQPDPLEGDTILRTSFPRVARSAFPVGRGVAALGRGVVRVQLPLADPAPDPRGPDVAAAPAAAVPLAAG